MVIYYYQDFNRGIKYSDANKNLAAERFFLVFGKTAKFILGEEKPQKRIKITITKLVAYIESILSNQPATSLVDCLFRGNPSRYAG